MSHYLQILFGGNLLPGSRVQVNQAVLVEQGCAFSSPGVICYWLFNLDISYIVLITYRFDLQAQLMEFNT